MCKPSINALRRERNQASDNAVFTQRLQMETLIIEQQLSLLRACRQFDEFRHKVSNTPMAVTHSAKPQSMDLLRREDGANPGALITYQEPSLLQIHQPQNDIDDLARVRSVSRSFVDHLLDRWTSLPNIIDGFRKIDLTGTTSDGESVKRIDNGYTPKDQANMGRLVRRNSNYRPAVAESEIDSEDESSRRQPKLRLSTSDPVLEEVDSNHLHSISLCVAGSVAEELLSPQHAQSWSNESGGFFCSSHGHSRPHQPPSPSPLSSPRASISSTNSPRRSFSSTNGSISGSLSNRPVTAFKPDNVSFPPPPTQEVQPAQQQRPAIPWRIRVNQDFWDYRDALLVGSNTRMEPRTAMKEFAAMTEIMSDYVTRDAVRERGFDFQRIRIPVNVPRGDGRSKTEMQSCLYIEGALGFNDIKRLVERTEELRAEDELRDRQRQTKDHQRREGPPRSPRISDERVAGVQTGGPVRPPPLERSQTSPVVRPGPPQRHGYTSTYHYSPRTSCSNSNSSLTSDSDTNDKTSRCKRDSSSRVGDFDTSTPTGNSSRHRRNSSLRGRDAYPRSPSRHNSNISHESSSRRNSSSYRDKSTSRRDSSPSSKKRDRRDSHSGRSDNISGKILTRTAAGLGLVTLLDGLPEVLSYL